MAESMSGDGKVANATKLRFLRTYRSRKIAETDSADCGQSLSAPPSSSFALPFFLPLTLSFVGPFSGLYTAFDIHGIPIGVPC
jgi:hypothetical protein